MKDSRYRAWALLAVMLISCGAWLYASRLIADPRVFLLAGEQGAQWVVWNQRFSTRARATGSFVVSFRKRFSLDQPVSNAVLTVHAFRLAEVLMDGRSLVQDRVRTLDDWKRPQSIDLTETLPAGPHELLVKVRNENAPPALMLVGDALDLRTGPDWEAQIEGQAWAPVRLAAAARTLAISRLLPSAPAALWERLPLLVVVFGIVFWTTLRAPEPRGPLRILMSASAARWAVLVAWAFLGAHNLLRLPDDIGFDADGHYAYIRYVAAGRGIPLATDGWQMFQSPLYYLVSAPLSWVLTWLVEPQLWRRLLRIVPFLCGAAQVQLAYLALRRTFPDRADLQAIGTAFAGLLPINLYMSQSLGNEPMAGCLSGATLVVSLGLLDPATPVTRRTLGCIGLLLGLALLTKLTAILLIPPILGAVIYSRRRDALWLRRAALDATLVLGTAAAVCGWYYVRNWMRLGRPFVGGWDPTRGIAWWQDPGYRTPEDLARFGEALVHPIAAGVVGFWDALYSTFWADAFLSGAAFPARPPWHYGFLSASVLLALIPTLVLVVGAAVALVDGKSSRRAPLRFALLAIGVQIAALLDLYMRLPVYAVGKAHYTLGVLICYALLLSAGLERLGREPVVRATLYGGLAAWGVAVYVAYLVAV